jgi:LPS export ABC transporter protein LptC
MTWQKRARLGVAVFGIAFAGVVFFAVGEREKPAAAPPPSRLDPSAIMETSDCVLKRTTGTRKDFTVTCDRYLQYENETGKLFGARIEMRERQGRDFLITGAEGLINYKTREIALANNVRLLASDGFELSTATATFNEQEGIVRTPGAVSFKKGAMSGTGVGMTYDKNTDVLTIVDKAHVRMVDEGGNTTGEFAAGSATLARVENYLALDRVMHALRGEQTIDADRATARLTENEQAITAIELRGNSRVAGGSAAFDSMSARDIDLDYADDGTTIERLVLTGTGAIALKGQGGAVGRQMRGESLTIALAADGSVTSAIARERAQLDLPADSGTAARQVRAKNFDATGETGKGLTAAQFSEDVEYREEAPDRTAPRTARSRLLTVSLDGNAISSAVFSGQVHFEEKPFKAFAAEARYEPVNGMLRLKGADQGGGPRVADDHIAIEAGTIDVTLEGRKMGAGGNVKTRLQSGANTPGLLDKERPTTITASGLQYEGHAGRAVYTGTAQLLQGDTAIRGETITIDQAKGNLTAVGNARSTLALGATPSVSRAQEIAYDNATRQITFLGIKPPPTPKPAPATLKPSRTADASEPSASGGAAGVPIAARGIPAHVSGPEGDLKADRIVAILHTSENRMQRLEAEDSVTLRLDQRLVTGARMTYHADGRYEMTSTTGVPVRIVEGCRETTGRTLTFFKATDNIIIDGNEEIRTRTTSGGPCPQPPPQ